MPRPNDQDLKTLTWLLKRLGEAEDYCRPYFERAKRHYRLYRFGSAVPENKWPYVNRTRSRDILAFIEDSTALLIQTLFATMPFFSVIPRETRVLYEMYKEQGIDAMLIGDQISRCLDYQISHEDTEFFEEIVDFYKGGMIFGNSYINVYPKFQADGTYLRPLLKTTDFWDVLPIAGARRVSKARGVFIREFSSLEELEALGVKGIYQNIDQVKGGGSSETNPDVNWHATLLQEVGMTNYQVDDANHEIIHYFSGGHVITFVDRKVIVRNSNELQKPEISNEQIEKSVETKIIQPYPYNLPTVQYKYMPVPLEFFGMGIPEVLEVLQEDKNLVRSARRDNIDLVINKILKAKSGADINFDLIKFYPGAIWPLENLTDIEEMDITDVTQNSYQEEARIAADMENALSLFGYARGMTPQHSEQPTTVMKLQQASLNRLDLAVKLAEFTTLQNIATRIILLTRRFMDPGIYEAIIGDYDAGFYKLNEEDIRRFFYFKPVGSSVTSIKEVRQGQIQAMMDMVSKVPPEAMVNNIEPFTVNLLEALKTGFDAVDIKNMDRILVRLQQQPQMPMGQESVPMGQDMNELAQVLYGGQY